MVLPRCGGMYMERFRGQDVVPVIGTMAKAPLLVSRAYPENVRMKLSPSKGDMGIMGQSTMRGALSATWRTGRKGPRTVLAFTFTHSVKLAASGNTTSSRRLPFRSRSYAELVVVSVALSIWDTVGHTVADALMNATVLDLLSSLPYNRRSSGTPGSIEADGRAHPSTVL